MRVSVKANSSMVYRVLTELQLREDGVSVGGTLYPFRLVGMTVQRLALPDPFSHLLFVHLLFSFVLGPTPEPHCESKREMPNIVDMIGRTARALVGEEETADEAQEAAEAHARAQLDLRGVRHICIQRPW